jgi:16S rRNA (cytidine1402-2'-O)-methyltransferase
MTNRLILVEISPMKLNLVTTPIGNLEDITQRAKAALGQADLIFAEDTRNTKQLLNLLGLPFGGKKIISFHDHKQENLEKFVAQIESAIFPVLVSDAGSPILSDPGFPLVKEVIARGGDVASIGGVSAVTAALELSGLPPQPFSFHGFLGRKSGEITSKLESCYSSGGTHIFFESPHRIQSTLELIAKNFPEFEVAVAREISKKFESVYRFKASEFDASHLVLKGEFVIVLYHRVSEESGASKDLKKLADAYMNKSSSKNLAKLLAAITGEKTSDVYSRLNC